MSHLLRWDRRTDRRTLDRFIDPARHSIWAASTRVSVITSGLPWGRNYYPHTHPSPIPTGITMGITIPTADPDHSFSDCPTLISPWFPALHLAPAVSALQPLQPGTLFLHLSVPVPVLTPSVVTSTLTISSTPSKPLSAFLNSCASDSAVTHHRARLGIDNYLLT